MGVVVNPQIVILYDANGVAMAIETGVAIPANTSGIIAAGSDGTNARFIKVATDGTVRIDPSGTTTQPISAASLPLPAGAATAALQTQPGVDIGDVTINNAAGASAVNIQDGGNSITVDGTVTANQGTAAALASAWPVEITDGTNTMPTGDAVGRAIFHKVTDGTNTATVKAASTAVVAADLALVVAISPNNTPVLPSGASTSALQTSGNASLTTIAAADDVARSTRLAEATFTTRINTHGQKAMAASTPVVIASDQTVIPVSDNGGSLTVDTPQLPAALVGARLDVNNGAWMGSTAPTVGQKAMASSIPVVISSDQTEVQVKQGTAAALSGYWPVRVTDGTNAMPTGDVVARSVFQQISDATTGPVAVKAASTAPVAVDKALVVVLSPNQQAIPVTSAPAASTPGLRSGTRILGGGSAGTLNDMRATTYTEPASGAQRSIVSTSANDSSAGTGARTVRITYFTSGMVGPLTENKTMNGTAAVNTTATNIWYIESIEVLTAGSLNANAGTINLKETTGGGGATIGSVGIGNVFVGVGDNRTLWAHHYTPTGAVSNFTGLACGATASSAFHIKSIDPTGSANVEAIVTGIIQTSSHFLRTFGTPIKVVGPARTTVYGVPSSNGVTLNASIDFYDT